MVDGRAEIMFESSKNLKPCMCELLDAKGATESSASSARFVGQ